MQTFTTGNLRVSIAGSSSSHICYMLYPFDIPGDWIKPAAERFGISLAIVTGMDWDNDLTPWPAPGQPPGSKDFKGKAPEFLSVLTHIVLPETEKRLNATGNVQRTLTGVSLSGLFTLWQWLFNDTFRNIISLSGSFWYEGFVEWVKSNPVMRKTGKAYFLLGDQEAKSKVKAFQSVQTDTLEIVKYLHDNGIEDYFELVPGNHYQNGEQRLHRAINHMFG